MGDDQGAQLLGGYAGGEPSTEDLPLDEPLTHTAQPDDPERKHKSAKADQERQNTEWRQIAFWGASATLVLIVLVSIAGQAAYLISQWGSLDPATMAAWFGANVIEIVGLMHIITRHLFPAEH